MGLRICQVKVLELCLMNVCPSKFSLIISGESLPLNIIRMERLRTTEYCYTAVVMTKLGGDCICAGGINVG